MGLALVLAMPASGGAFSVLAHQAIVDQAWQPQLLPMLRKRFPNATQQQLDDAHDYARGGSHLPDLGYFPLGSRTFSDLLHYVRTGDFVTCLLNEARSPDEYAFALGVLAHYEADSSGHPEATNLAVPIIYPKLDRRFGDVVTYADSPSAHLETEFRFDVLQVAHRQQIPGLFEQSVSFKVPKELLERAFRDTYGISLDDLFINYDVAINTYRWGFRTLINEGTGIAWQLYREDINSLEPGITYHQFDHPVSRGDFIKEFGNAFLEPGYFARFVGFLGNLIPNVGPFKRLPYKPLPKDVQELYFRAYHNAYQQYVAELAAIEARRAWLADVNLDTGRVIGPGQYQPADRAYAALLQKLAQHHFDHVSRALADDLLDHFRDRKAAVAFETDAGKRARILTAVSELQRSEASAPPPLETKAPASVGNSANHAS